MLAEISIEGVTHWKIIVLFGTATVSIYGALFVLWRFISSHISNSEIHFDKDEFVKVEVCLQIQKRMDEREHKQDERHKLIQSQINEIKDNVKDGFSEVKALITNHNK